MGNLPECLFQEESLTERCISAFLEGLELWGHEDRLAGPGFSHKHHADSLSLYLGQPCISNWRVTRLQCTRELLKIPMGQKCASVTGPLPATQPVGITGIHDSMFPVNISVFSLGSQVIPRPNPQCSPSPKPQRPNSLE